MIPYYENAEHRAWLIDAAQEWMGTPFAGHQRVRGAGVDCVHLAAALYHESRLLPEMTVFERYNLDGGQHSARNVMGEWLLASPQFSLAWAGSGGFKQPQIGDLLCLTLGRQPWHCAVMLDAGELVEVHHKSTVARRPLADPTWSRRVAQIWRPIFI